MQEILNQVYLNNTVSRYLWSLGTFILSLLIILLLKNFILSRLFNWVTKKTGEQDTKLLYTVNKYLLITMYFLAFYISEKFLYKSPMLKKILDTSSLAIFVYLLTIFVTTFLEFGLNRYSEKFGDDTGRRLAFQWINRFLRILVWIIAAILFVQNLGVQIGALVTGLGVGGVALAFAAQTILGEIFSYFTIFFDKPFEVGDFINTGEFSGSVERIGLRTTKLRSIGGEQLIFSNKDLTNARVKNYKRMDERRVSFNLSVVYNTPNEKLKMIPPMIKEIVEAEPDTRFDRAHFSAYTEYSLKFDIVYYYLSSDYNGYMDTQQRINFSIKEFFESNHINFAYPTQTILYNENKIDSI